MSSKTANPTPDQKAALDAAGIDWNTIQNLDWSQVVVIINALIALFRRRMPVGAVGHHDPAHLKALFEAQKALAECGIECLDHQP